MTKKTRRAESAARENKKRKYVCIHGHFYQPPRENAWLEEIEVQDSAHPFHDWNERITAECYMPNSCSRILGNDGVIKNIVNNYSKINFNFGPTLLSWMKGCNREVYDAILEADKESMTLFQGHGSAIAQAYNHIIMPLANSRDKETQIIWGIRDFEYRFERKPEGMWLAETAVDTETLDLLVKHGIKYTILAPGQAKAVRKMAEKDEGDEPWTTVKHDTVNTQRAYQYNLPSGRSIALFFYDGNVSQSVAFNGLLNDGESFANALLDTLDEWSDTPQLAHIATDGETYGHHHKQGEMALSYCLDYIEKKSDVDLVNYGLFLELHPPTHEVQIHELSSWSCVHGVERWRSDCGCCSGMNGGWQQKWRQPLREALDWLCDVAVAVFEKESAMALHDPWAARNDYIDVIIDRGEENVQKFLEAHAFPAASSNQVLRLLEMQRHAMLMYTSCGWFFDEISGIETTQIMQYACRVLQIANQLGSPDSEQKFVELLSKAPSNLSHLEHGGKIFEKYVTPARTNLEGVGMHYAVASIFEDEPESHSVFNYTTVSEAFVRKELGELRLALGITRVKSIVTKTEKKFAFAVLYLGKHNIIGSISLNMDLDIYVKMQDEIVKSFGEGRIGDVMSIMESYFGSEKYTLWQLFHDEKRKILNMITRQSLSELETSLQRTYNRDYPLITALAKAEIPIPDAYRTAFEYVLNMDLKKSFAEDRIHIKTMERVASGLAHWDMKILDRAKIERLAGDAIYSDLDRISDELNNTRKIIKVNKVFPLLKNLDLSPDLHRSQNLYFEMSVRISNELSLSKMNPGWIEQFNILGDHLGVKVELN